MTESSGLSPKRPPADRVAGTFVTETFDYDGGRQVTVSRPTKSNPSLSAILLRSRSIQRELRRERVADRMRSRRSLREGGRIRLSPPIDQTFDIDVPDVNHTKLLIHYRCFEVRLGSAA